VVMRGLAVKPFLAIRIHPLTISYASPAMAVDIVLIPFAFGNTEANDHTDTSCDYGWEWLFGSVTGPSFKREGL